MKKALFALLLAPSMSFAHGSKAHQASEAVEAAVHLFESTQTVQIQREFVEIHAKHVGHELFDVTINLKTGDVLNYACAEDETVSPVVWGCEAK